MNVPSTPRALARHGLESLHGLVGEIGWLEETGAAPPKGRAAPDAWICFGSGSGAEVRLDVYALTQVRPATFPAWAAPRRDASLGDGAVPVLVTPSVSARMAEVCRRTGWSWLDLAGNCWLDVPGSFHVERTGRPAVGRPHRPPANLGTPAAGRVLRTLLSPGTAGTEWTQRRLAAQTCRPKDDKSAGVSLGLVNKVVRHLRDEGYVTDAGGSGVRVRDPLGLLGAWSAAYRFDRHERRSYFTLLQGPGLEAELYQAGLEAGGWLAYAAFSAAERQAPHVRQARTWLYAEPDVVDVLAARVDANEVDSGENMIVLIPDDRGVYLSWEPRGLVGEQVLSVTDPVQTYVDLSHCGGRGEEAAQAILDQRLLPAWKKAGLL